MIILKQRKHQSAIIILMILFLSACSILAPVKTSIENKYVLKNTPVMKKKSTRNVALLVTPVTTLPLYDTTSMAYTTSPYQIDYFVKSEWATLPVKMIQPLIVKTLVNTHHFRGVLSLPTDAKYDYILNTQLVELKQAFHRKRSVYQILIRVDLIQARTSKLIASKEFNETVATEENTAYGGVIAANKAIEKILSKIALLCMKHA